MSTSAAPTVEPVRPSVEPIGEPSRPRRGLYVLVFLLAVFPHAVGIGNGFLGWDDADAILSNLHIRRLSLENLKWMFTTFHMGPYQPLTWLTLAIDYSLWGFIPVGYHLTNVLLHGIAAVFCAAVAWRLYRCSDGSVASEFRGLGLGAVTAALLFAAHPLRVESVAWVTERRDVLSGALVLAATLVYIGAVTHGSTARRWLAWLLFGLAGLAKATVVPWPLVLLLLDWYPFRRFERIRSSEFVRCVLEKLPAFAIALTLGIVAIIGQLSAGALASFDSFPVWRRFLSAAFGIGLYLSKLAVPLYLSPIYEQPHRLELWHYAYIGLGICLLVGVTVVTWRYRRRWPAAWVAWLAFLTILAPVSGILQTGPQIAADRYTYLCMIPIAIAAGRGIGLLARDEGAYRPVVLVVAVSYLVLAVLTFRQTLVWNNDMALWEYAVRVQPRSSLAYTNLAAQHYQQNNLAQAERYARKALRLRPNNAAAHNVLANVLAERGRLEEAVREYEIALKIRPKNPMYMYNLASVLRHLDREDEAIELLEEVLRLQPDYLAAMNNLALLYKARKEYDKAERLLRRTVELDPLSATAVYNLANLKLEQGEEEEAERLYRRALTLDATLGEAAVQLAYIYRQRGDWQRAKAVLQHAYLANPSHASVRYHLGLLLAAAPDPGLREPRAAIQHGRWLIEEVRDARGFDVLAAAYAALGDFDEAVRTIDQGIIVMRNLGAQEHVRVYQERRKLYMDRKPLVLGTETTPEEEPIPEAAGDH